MRNKILVALLLIVSLSFVALLVIFENKQAPVVNQITKKNETISPTPQEKVSLVFEPASLAVNTGEEFRLKLTFKNLDSPLTAADLILEFDPKLVEFVGVENLAAGYLNPRQLKSDNRLIVSFVEDLNATTVESSQLQMGELVFKALTPGLAKIVPVLNKEAKSSMVTTKNFSYDNQLTAVNEVEVIIQ